MHIVPPYLSIHDSRHQWRYFLHWFSNRWLNQSVTMRCLSVYSSIFHILKNKSPFKPHLVHVEFVFDDSIYILQCISISSFWVVSDKNGYFWKKDSTDYNTCKIFVSVEIADNKVLFVLQMMDFIAIIGTNNYAFLLQSI